jgi:hypothetical protein
MNSSKRSRIGRNMVKPLVIAVALSLPAAAALAEDMSHVVTTRADQNIDQQYGRDSVYAFSRDAKPFTPEQTGSRQGNWLAKSWDKTKAYAADTWHRTESFFTRHAAASTNPEPQRYGRAGGYVGSDRVTMLQATPAVAATSESTTVKTEEAQGITERPTGMAPAPMTEESPPVIEQSPVASKQDGSPTVAPNDYTPNQGPMESDDVTRNTAPGSDNGRVESDTAHAEDDMSNQIR